MDARDFLVILISVFAIGVLSFAFHYVMNTVVDYTIAVPVIAENNNSVAAFESSKTLVDRLDYVVFIIFIASTIALWIGAYFTNGNPILSIIYIIVVIIGIVLSTVLSNVWDDITSASVFGATVASFTFSNHVINYMPIYASIVGVIGMVIMFIRPQFTQQYG